ncbi:hypothetical protein [Salinicoccus carnicancri]|uniref:hypothetical protein n=1 Tax=Salinicoccus carnicancri TaxID=558170 RepID=UPI0003647728|nr:hypothetical protein [Salinicoccus carnicancri]
MRIFICGVIAALIIGFAWGVFIPDDEYLELGNQAVIAAFICGAASQAIKQFKE